MGEQVQAKVHVRRIRGWSVKIGDYRFAVSLAEDEIVVDGEQVDLAISGMTCGACAMKVEKSLNSIEGVSATVNFATETARITLHDAVTTEQLVAEVEKAGYGARLVADTTPEMLDKETNERVAMLRTRLTVSLVAGIPVRLACKGLAHGRAPAAAAPWRTCREHSSGNMATAMTTTQRPKAL